jgi:hypothetical protein
MTLVEDVVVADASEDHHDLGGRIGKNRGRLAYNR